MKCEKSFKRVMITRWGIKELGKGRVLDAVKADMKRMGRLTVAEVQKAVAS